VTYRLPTSVTILGVRVPVLLRDDMEPTTFGEWHSGDLSISINMVCPDEHQRVVLIHEILHALDDFLDLGLSHKNIYGLSQAFFALIRANPDLIFYTVDGPEES